MNHQITKFYFNINKNFVKLNLFQVEKLTLLLYITNINNVKIIIMLI